MVKNPSFGYFVPNTIEVEKMVPGRVMTLSVKGGNLKIELSRSPIEISFVILGAMVFIMLSAMITLAIFSAPKGLTGTEGIVAVAGFILSLRLAFGILFGFVPRASGTTLFELLTFGLHSSFS